jgi:hypothetical protein
MRHTLVYSLFLTIVLTVWALAYQGACDAELARAQREPPSPQLLQAQARAVLASCGASTVPTSQPLADLEIDE